MPWATPPIVPVARPMVAMDVLPLLHVPPAFASDNVVEAVVHIPVTPVIGELLTVTVFVAFVPQPVEYVMVLVPFATPVTTPVVEPTVATDALLLLQIPYNEVLLKAVVEPEQTLVVPVIAALGAVCTVTVDIALAVPQLFVTE